MADAFDTFALPTDHAEHAFEPWRATPPAARAPLLRAIADALESDRGVLVATADRETSLGAARLNGELDRTSGQLRMFAAIAEEGSFVEAIVSTPDPDAKPIPRPDVRRMLVPLGPVAVFTPSNFPLAFGVAGGDSASALAAGCPIVVKGHPSHPETSDACARAIERAVERVDAPRGVFSLVQSADPAVSRALVRDPAIQAVAFTGSLAAGRALFDVAAARPDPIPVYAEMGSVNPVFISPAALGARADAIAEGLAGSITQGTGQFCTKPGLAFVPDDDRGRQFARALAARLDKWPAGPMLNASLAQTLDRDLAAIAGLEGVERLTGAAASGEERRRGATLVAADRETWMASRLLRDEHFGPFSVIVFCEPDRMAHVARVMSGSLTATIHAEPSDREWASGLADALSTRAGRIVWNGYPTGVAVTWAMHHGGPYPASTSPLHTSVGATAIRRFLRPVAWQNTPDDLLPEALRDANPLGIQRLVDGEWTRLPL
jgi:acyl-CoA reductase-like NAD-dependent aldehyde dehydrogenase